MLNQLRTTALLGVVILGTLAVGAAKDKKKENDRERVYDAPYEEVWSACIRVAHEKHTLRGYDKTEGLLSFVPRRTWIEVAVTVISVDANHTKLILNPITLQWTPFPNGKDAPKNYLDAVGEALKVK